VQNREKIACYASKPPFVSDFARFPGGTIMLPSDVRNRD
jgi:hypothetical protein